jgi:hypothetical protein
METLQEARDTIFNELTSEDAEVRSDYLKHFEGGAKAFAEYMADSFVKWRAFDSHIKDDGRAHVSALVYIAITLHVLSMKLLLSGQTIAAGNLFRQVIESIALAPAKTRGFCNVSCRTSTRAKTQFAMSCGTMRNYR